MNSALIPPITDELGRHWQQPPLEQIAIDEKHAMMTRADLDQLASALAREVRNYGSCRQRIHDDGPCGCGHCVVLRMYEKHVAENAIVQTPQSAAELTRDI